MSLYPRPKLRAGMRNSCGNPANPN